MAKCASELVVLVGTPAECVGVRAIWARGTLKLGTNCAVPARWDTASGHRGATLEQERLPGNCGKIMKLIFKRGQSQFPTTNDKFDVWRCRLSIGFDYFRNFF